MLLKKSLLPVVLLFSCSVLAQEQAFDSSFDALGQAEIIQKPSCDTPLFEQKALHSIKTFLEEKPVFTTINQRKKALKLKKLNGFENVDIAHFSPETDYMTANALIELQINQHVDQKDILLCRQKGDIQKPIYIILYPYMDNFKAYIIGADENSGRYDHLSFIYP